MRVIERYWTVVQHRALAQLTRKDGHDLPSGPMFCSWQTRQVGTARLAEKSPNSERDRTSKARFGIGRTT